MIEMSGSEVMLASSPPLRNAATCSLMPRNVRSQSFQPRAAALERFVQDRLFADAPALELQFQAFQIGKALELAALDERVPHDDGLETQVGGAAGLVGNELYRNLSLVCVVVPADTAPEPTSRSPEASGAIMPEAEGKGENLSSMPAALK